MTVAIEGCRKALEPYRMTSQTMPSESEKRRRKAVLHDLKAAERIKSEAALPAPKNQLEALFHWVEEHPGGGCDHTHRHTVEFINASGLDEQQVIEWLRNHGGYCDCEVVMNVRDSCPALH